MGKIEPEQPRAQVARRNVDERAVAQDASGEGRAIARDGALILGTSRDEVVRHRRERLARDRFEFVEVERLGHQLRDSHGARGAIAKFSAERRSA